jgi:hypothetical protein
VVGGVVGVRSEVGKGSVCVWGGGEGGGDVASFCCA